VSNRVIACVAWTDCREYCWWTAVNVVLWCCWYSIKCHYLASQVSSNVLGLLKRTIGG